MTKTQLRYIIGENIRSVRMSRNMSIDELADMLELTSGFVGLIERGQRGATPITLLKLADVFGTSIDTFFFRSSGDSMSISFAEEPETLSKRKKIFSLISDFSVAELSFVIQMVKSLRLLFHPRVENQDMDDDMDSGIETLT